MNLSQAQLMLIQRWKFSTVSITIIFAVNPSMSFKNTF